MTESRRGPARKLPVERGERLVGRGEPLEQVGDRQRRRPVQSAAERSQAGEDDRYGLAQAEAATRAASADDDNSW